MGDPSMTIVLVFNQYFDYYKIVVLSGYVCNYVLMIIMNSARDSFRISSMIFNTNDVVYD